jgi:CheY-like chemotaxis protein
VKSIQLAEDIKFLRHANKRALTRAGYTVVVACDGEEGLRTAREGSYDLILLDMLLPKLSGPDVLSALRANSRTAEVPVIVLSGLSQRNEVKLLQDGMKRFPDQTEFITAIAGVKIVTDRRDEAIQFLTEGVRKAPRSTELAIMLTELLIDQIGKEGLAVSANLVLGQIHRIPAVLDKAFPGYAGAGLLHLIVRRAA